MKVYVIIDIKLKRRSFILKIILLVIIPSNDLGNSFLKNPNYIKSSLINSKILRSKSQLINVYLLTMESKRKHKVWLLKDKYFVLYVIFSLERRF